MNFRAFFSFLSFFSSLLFIRRTSATNLIFVSFRILASDQFMLFERIYFFFFFRSSIESKNTVSLNLRRGFVRNVIGSIDAEHKEYLKNFRVSTVVRAIRD